MTKKLPKDWKPSSQLLALAKGRGMPIEDWLYHLLPEFRMYWEDCGKKKDSWDATFWNHAKREWERVDKSKMYRKATDILPSKPKTATNTLPNKPKTATDILSTKPPVHIDKPPTQEERAALVDKWMDKIKLSGFK